MKMGINESTNFTHYEWTYHIVCYIYTCLFNAQRLLTSQEMDYVLYVQISISSTVHLFDTLHNLHLVARNLHFKRMCFAFDFVYASLHRYTHTHARAKNEADSRHNVNVRCIIIHQRNFYVIECIFYFVANYFVIQFKFAHHRAAAAAASQWSVE